MITPAVAAYLEFPLCCVGTRTVGVIKLVAPYESPPGFSGLRRKISCRGLADAERRQQGHGCEGKTSVVQVGISFFNFKKAANLTPVPLFASSAKQCSPGAARKGVQGIDLGGNCEVRGLFQPTAQPTNCDVLYDLQAFWQSPRSFKL
jgi:hypothetical protein